jgi:hypothetical protein
MATTYTLISSVTVGSGGAANIEFTSIPADYTDLNVVFSIRCARSAVSEPLMMRFNSNTSNYSLRRLNADGSSVSSDSVSGETGMIVGDINGDTSTSNTFGNGSIYIPNYAGSNNKSVSTDVVVENNATLSSQYLLAGLWSDSSAITTIRLYSRNSHNFNQYSTAYLYGISNA